MSKQIYIIHENDEWVVPLRAQLEQRNLPYKEWFLGEGNLNIDETPPEGVFYNRMSASSHTRGHRYAPEHTSAVLAWLELHGRKVFNNKQALSLELNKVAQYTAFKKYGVKTPRTVATVGKDSLIEAAKNFELPFITKHNRAGKGLGVRLFHTVKSLEEYVWSDDFEEPVDGITLLQQYITSPEPFITRVEFVGGDFVYAVRVDTSEGFELCPADSCTIGDQFCPTTVQPNHKFEILEHFESPLIESYKKVLIDNGIHVAGIEFIVDNDGITYTYDLNTNTNYNGQAEGRDVKGRSGMGALADFLGDALLSI